VSYEPEDIESTILFLKEIMITSQEILVSDEMKESNGVRKLDFKWNLVDLDKINRTASDFICLSFNKPADQNRSDVILGPTHLKIKDRDPLETALLLENLAVSLTKQAMLKHPSIKSNEDEVEVKAGERSSGKLNRMSIRYRKSFKKKSLKSEEAIAPIQEDNNTSCNSKSIEKSMQSHKSHHTKQKSNNVTRSEQTTKENENKFLAKLKSRAIPQHTRSVSQGTSESIRLSTKSERRSKKKEHKRETSLSSKRESVPSSAKRESISSSKRGSAPPKCESVTIIPTISSPLAPKTNLSPLTARNQSVEQLPSNHRASRKDCNCILCLYEHSQKSKTVIHNKENMSVSVQPDTGKSDLSVGSPEITFEEIQQTLNEISTNSVNLISN